MKIKKKISPAASFNEIRLKTYLNREFHKTVKKDEILTILFDDIDLRLIWVYVKCTIALVYELLEVIT